MNSAHYYLEKNIYGYFRCVPTLGFYLYYTYSIRPGLRSQRRGRTTVNRLSSVSANQNMVYKKYELPCIKFIPIPKESSTWEASWRLASESNLEESTHPMRRWSDSVDVLAVIEKCDSQGM